MLGPMRPSHRDEFVLQRTKPFVAAVNCVQVSFVNTAVLERLGMGNSIPHCNSRLKGGPTLISESDGQLLSECSFRSPVHGTKLSLQL
jgi:hypothetical protein